MFSLGLRSSLFTVLLCLPLCALDAGQARAESADHQTWNFVSGSGNLLYLAAGIGLPLIEDGRAGRNHALRALDAAGTGVLQNVTA